MAGQVPARRKGYGTLPSAGWELDAGWEDLPVPFDKVPAVLDPDEGFVVTANNGLGLENDGPFLSADWLPPYRQRRIAEMLRSRNDWGVDSTLSLQMDQLSLPWLDMRSGVLAAPGASAESARTLEMLAAWDGRVAADSTAASLYEFFVWEMTRRLAEAKAPHSHRWALGDGFTPLTVRTIIGHRLICLLVRLMEERPDDWFGRPWLAEVDAALSAAYAGLRLRFGPDERLWAWGRVRPTTLRHPASARRPLGLLLDLGPFPLGRRLGHREPGSRNDAGPVRWRVGRRVFAHGDRRRQLGRQPVRAAGRPVRQSTFASLLRHAAALAAWHGSAHRLVRRGGG